MKLSRWFALLLAVTFLFVGAIVVSAIPHKVQSGDTLFSLARQYGTSVEEIASANSIADPNLIYADQTLEIPSAGPAVAAAPVAAYHVVPAGNMFTYVVQKGDTLYSIARHFDSTVAALAQVNDIRNVSYLTIGEVLLVPGDVLDAPSVVIPTTDIPHASTSRTALVGVTPGSACARINFEKGIDRRLGAVSDGVFVLKEFNGRGAIATWHAKAGEVDSGWIENINITFDAVNVMVVFYPEDGSEPILMEIINPAPDSHFGWVANDMCHAIEVQYPRW